MTSTTTTTTNSRVIWRYATLGGAPVVVTRHDDQAYTETEFGGRVVVHDCRWLCLGCGSGSHSVDVDPESVCQSGADRHAAECRAMAPVGEGTPSPTTAILAGLAGVRQELADLTAAVRDLADPVNEAACALADITEVLSDLPDREGLADIATAVESLAASVDDRPRRSWWGRRRSVQAGEVSA